MKSLIIYTSDSDGPHRYRVPTTEGDIYIRTQVTQRGVDEAFETAEPAEDEMLASVIHLGKGGFDLQPYEPLDVSA